MKRRLLIICLLALSYPTVIVHPQNPDTQKWESVLETLLSDEELSQDALEELAAMYESLHEAPLNINTATREELSAFPFLTDRQIEDIHAYIYMHGPMKTLGELQFTGSLDYRTRVLLREFVYAGDIPARKEKFRVGDILKYGRNELVLRTDFPLYTRDGFRYHSPQELARYPNRAYRGDRLWHSLRYSFNWHNRIRIGFTADKDAGEQKVDFFSPYIYVRDVGVIKEFALGNYKAQFGLGLLLGGGFSVGKSMALSSLARQSQGLKPHASTQEYGYLRGAGIAAGRRHVTFTILAASTPLDATLKGDSAISSFKEDGYHRTGLELSKKHNVTLNTFAANVRYSYRGVRFGVTALHETLSLPYKGYDRYGGLSADFGINRRRYSFTTEFSMTHGKPALIASQTFRLKKEWDINILLRHYSPDYLSLHSNAMAEGSVSNETGLLAGFSHSSRTLSISGYADLFRHPMSRYGASGPSNGMDLRAEAEWNVGKRDELYATARFKSKQKDCKYTGRLEYCWTGRYRLRWTHDLHGGAAISTQLLYARYDFIAQPISNGYALTGNYCRSLLKERMEMNLSAAAFYADSYDSRISVYESGIRYSYNFISLYGQGGRVAATLKWNIRRGMQLNVKAAGIYYLDREEISSAQQRIASNHKEDISVQFIAKF